MHRHITYYTQSTVCQGGFSNKFHSSIVHGRMQDLLRGGQLFFFFLGGGGACDAWRSQAFARGFGGMLPQNFLGGMVQSGAFWSIFS